MIKRIFSSGRNLSTGQIQWGPGLTWHDPNPPITLESPSTLGATISAAPQDQSLGRAAGFAVIFAAVAAAAVAPKPVMAYAQTAPEVQNQYAVADQQATRSLFPSQRAGQRTPIIPFYSAPPQTYVDPPSFIRSSVASPQGPTGGATYTFGLHAIALYNAEAAKTRLWPAQATPVAAVTVPPLVRTAGQLEERPTVVTWPAQRAGQTTPVLSYVLGAPQTDPTQIQPAVWISRVAGATPRIAAYVSASQQAYVDPPSALWPTQRTPAVTTQPVAAFVATAEQPQDRPTVAVWAAQFRGQTTPVIPYIIGGPQQLDLTLKALYVAPLVGRASTLPYVLAAPQAIDLTQQALYSAPVIGRLPALPYVSAAPQQVDLAPRPLYTGPVARQGSVPPLVYGTAQADSTQLAAQYFPTLRTLPITAGALGVYLVVPAQFEERPTVARWPSQRAGQTPPIVPYVYGVPPQQDLTQQALYVAPPIGRLPALPYITAATQAYVDPVAVVWPSVASPQGPTGGATYTFGLHAVALYNAEAAKTQVWGTLRTPPFVAQPVCSFIVTREQPQDRPTVAVWSPVKLSQGRVPPMVRAAPLQRDLTLQAMFIPMSAAVPITNYDTSRIRIGSGPEFTVLGSDEFNIIGAIEDDL